MSRVVMLVDDRLIVISPTFINTVLFSRDTDIRRTGLDRDLMMWAWCLSS